MARIIYSGLVTSIKGSVGGTTFQSNAYGNTVKNKANMIIPNSVSQELRKLIFSKATKGWSSLTSVQRSNWETYAAAFPQFAKNNPSAVLSGFSVFVKWHAAFFLGKGLDNPFNTGAVLANPPLDTVALTLVNAASVLTLGRTWVIGDETFNVNFFLSRPFSPSQNFSGSSPRFIVSLTNVDGSSAITTAYLAQYGSLPVVGSAINVATQLYVESGGKVLATSVQRIIVT